jgi:alkanesulfonate monooxygenase SsuD/methylene tetrahydromethanopterin reductase-like flavin-dependent oxidoreductase (luciferase family)
MTAMTDAHVPLAVLDLAPIVSGATVSDAVANSIDLARHVESAGYRRHWLAEHHFTPGVASSATSILIGQVAAATSSIRVGSAAVQTGHQTPLSIVEQFGTLDAFFPGRIDLGLGRSGQRRAEAISELAARTAGTGKDDSNAASPSARIVDGLLIPKPFSFSSLLGSSRFASMHSHLQQPGAQSPDYAEQLDEILAFLAGTLRTPDGDPIRAVPGVGAQVDVWIFGSSAGQSAQVAAERGLPFAANYHVSPATVLEAVDAYRAAFRPSKHLHAPYVAVSADVVVADDDETAQHLASPYGLWVRSIRTGKGAVEFPTPEEAAKHVWSDDDRDLVADRVDTQFVGSPSTVAAGLEILARATGADELVVTTITHDHADRVRSYELLAREWFAVRGSSAISEPARASG